MSLKEVKFSIKHLDPKGQGVFKADKVYFIANTLPGEEGMASVFKENSKIAFAKVTAPTKLNKKSIDRITPKCPYYFDCGGCHYLHTTYEQEIIFKTKSLEWIFKNILTPKVEVFKSSNRFGYRNRIQLHYNKSKKIIGFKTSHNKILNIKNCLLADETIQNYLQEKLPDFFNTVLQSSPATGHIEFYLNKDNLEVVKNSAYAASGFSQVNQEMNEQLKQYIFQYYQDYSFDKILDLFGGNGNLSSMFTSPTTIIDVYKKSIPSSNLKQFINLNLFKQSDIKSLFKVCQSCELLIIDPPRSGFKHIAEVVAHYQPKEILYVSCSPMTLARDIKPLEINYQVERIVLFDFFPGTYHFETCVMLKKK